MEEIEYKDKVEEVNEPVTIFSQEILPLFSVKVIHPSLRRRSTPEIAENVVGVITDRGIYEIYKVNGDWGQLQDNSWIMLQYTEKISE